MGKIKRYTRFLSLNPGSDAFDQMALGKSINHSTNYFLSIYYVLGREHRNELIFFNPHSYRTLLYKCKRDKQNKLEYYTSMSDSNKKKISLKEIQGLWGKRKYRRKLFPDILNRDSTYLFDNLGSALMAQI